MIKNGIDAKCRLSDNLTRTAEQLIAGCPVLALNKYKHGHDRVGQYLHRKIFKHYQLSAPNNWFEHHLQAVVEKDATILWDYPIHTDRNIQANKTYIIVKDSVEETCPLIDVSVTTVQNIAAVEIDKLSKYEDLEIEISRMWNLTAITLASFLFLW